MPDEDLPLRLKLLGLRVLLISRIRVAICCVIVVPPFVIVPRSSRSRLRLHRRGGERLHALAAVAQLDSGQMPPQLLEIAARCGRCMSTNHVVSCVINF